TVASGTWPEAPWARPPPIRRQSDHSDNEDEDREVGLPQPAVLVITLAQGSARLARRAVSLPLVEFAGEVEHHVPVESAHLAQSTEHASDAVVSGVARGLGLGGVAHVGLDVTIRQCKVVEAAAGLGLTVVVPTGDLQQALGQLATC